MDGLYGDVPHLMRGRVISRNELVFQLANVTGAALAVLVYPGPRIGFAAVAVFLILAGLSYASEMRLSLRNEAGRFLLGHRPLLLTEGLPLALLAEAMRYAERGDHYVAVVVAESAVRVVDARSGAGADCAQQEAWNAVAGEVAAVVEGRLEPTYETSRAVIDAAGALIATRRP